MKKLVITTGIAFAALFGAGVANILNETTGYKEEIVVSKVKTDETITWNGEEYTVLQWIGNTGDAVIENKYEETNYYVGDDVLFSQYDIWYSLITQTPKEVSYYDFETGTETQLGEVLYPGRRGAEQGAAYFYTDTNLYVDGAGYTYEGSLQAETFNLTPIEGAVGFETINDSIYKKETSDDMYYYYNGRVYSEENLNNADTITWENVQLKKAYAGDYVVQFNNEGTMEYYVTANNMILNVKNLKQNFGDEGVTTFVATDDFGTEWTLVSEAASYDDVSSYTRLATVSKEDSSSDDMVYVSGTDKGWILNGSVKDYGVIQYNGEYKEVIKVDEMNITGTDETFIEFTFKDETQVIYYNGELMDELPKDEDEPTSIGLPDLINSVDESDISGLEDIIYSETGNEVDISEVEVPPTVVIDGEEFNTEVVVQNSEMTHFVYVQEDPETGETIEVEMTAIVFHDEATNTSHMIPVPFDGVWEWASSATTVAEAIAITMIIILVFFMLILALVIIASLVAWFAHKRKSGIY